MRYSLGCHAEPAGHRVTPVSHLLGDTFTDVLPASVTSLKQYVKLIDQLQSSSCVAHAIKGATNVILSCQGEGIGETSPLAHYALARAIDRTKVNGQLTPLQDNGSEPNQAMRAMSEWGLCPYALRPTDMSLVNLEPTILEVEGGRSLELSGYYAIDQLDPVPQAKHALASGIPVCFAMLATSQLMDWIPGNPPLGAPVGTILGGHYLYIVGYTTNPDRSTTFEFVNSWGDGWGDKGFGLLSEEGLRAAYAQYVMDVRIIK